MASIFRLSPRIFGMRTCKICTLDNKFCFKRTLNFVLHQIWPNRKHHAPGDVSIRQLNIKLTELRFQPLDVTVEKFRCLARKGGTGANVLIEKSW
jgi:hypothetical protein